MKKLFAVLLALTLVLSMGTMALAAGETGSITITNPTKNAQYDFYRIFDLVSYDTANGTYSYKLSTKWAGFTAPGYINIDEDGYVKWVSDDTENDGEAIKAFVGLALEYADKESIDYDTFKKADSDQALTIDGLPLGYYLVDTSLGTLCSITTTNPDIEITDKNQKPDINKLVQEDRDNSWGEVNDANIGQTVYYKSTVKVGKGAFKYIMHDTMTKGLSYNNDAIVYVGDQQIDAVVDGETKYRVVTDNLDDDCTFEIRFEDSFINGFEPDETFEVRYSATLNEEAEIVNKGNDNTVWLTYGENNQFSSEEYKTTTYTWKIDVFKWTEGENKSVVALPNAKFMLLTAKKDKTTAIKFTKVEDTIVEGVNIPTYMVDPDGSETEIITNDTGKFIIEGLDEGVYYLHESEAPAGYNELGDDLTVTITSEVKDKKYTDNISYEINDDAPATIKVENKTGALLPETGGIGTTIFYIVGITLMLGAAIVLVSKKRMASFA